MTIESGRVLNERYRLIGPVGQGAQASVWLAEHLALGSQVAVKLIDPELAKKEDALERFRREATAAAQLRSAHVVQILDHGVDETQPYIVMELLDGEDLFERLDKRKRLSVKETSKIVTQVARALTRAHAAGIVHRDLKPENVFLVPNEDDEIAKVLDFGVAKVVDPAKRTMQRTGVGTLIGTPHYMSPEQVKGVTEVDYRADLWALGVIAYQCVTGELPFDSEGVGDLLIKITIGDLPVPSKVCPGVPSTFDVWFAKACQRDPDKRFESARDMADALARAVGIPAPEAAPTSVPRPHGGRASFPGARVSSPDDAATPAPVVAPPREHPGAAAAPADAEHEAPTHAVPAALASAGDLEARSHERSPSARPPMDSTDVTFEEGEGSDPYAVPRASKRPPPRPMPDVVEALPAPPRAPSPQRPAPLSAESSVPRTTVSGLASSGVSMMPPPELDGSRGRRTKRFLLLAFVAGAGAVAWFAAKPYLTPPVPVPAASAVPTGRDDPRPAPVEDPATSGTASAAVDPGKRAAPATATPPPARPAGTAVPRPSKATGTKKKSADGSIEIPEPDEIVPLKPGQPAPGPASQGPPPEPEDIPPP